MFNQDTTIAKEQIIAYTKALHSEPAETAEERTSQVNNIINDYVNSTGERPNERTLSYLADYILIDILKSTKKNKPIKSNSGMKRNMERDLPLDEGRV
jgi:hypothetical protein